MSKYVKGYDEMKAIGKKVGSAWEKSPMMRQMNMLAMIDKMDGFPLQTVMQVMGGQTISTLKKVEERTFSEDLFKVPAGYKLVHMGPMGRP